MARIKKEQTVLKQVQQLINKECANYFYKSDDTPNYCCKEWTKDLLCVYFQSEPEFERCKYFEDAVLPTSEIIDTIYRTQMDISRALTSEEQKEIKYNINNKNMIKCDTCGDMFSAKSNRQKNCEMCGNIIKRENQKTRYIDKKKRVGL